MARIPGGYSVRLAIIVKVYKTQVECRYLDREGEHNIRCPIPHPCAGTGTGIFVGFQKNTKVLIAMAPQEQPYIVAIIPEHGYYFDQSGVSDSSVDVSPYPDIKPGEISLKGKNSSIDLTTNSVCLDCGAGENGVDLEISRLSKAMFVRTSNLYSFSEAGRKTEGVVRRDKGDVEDPNDTKTLDFLSGIAYDSILVDIGRSPEDEVSLRSSMVSKLTIRNPALVEKRDITYEFADSFGVRDIESESSATTLINQNNINESSNNIVVNPSHRENRRTDSLDLNLRNFNHLIEKTEGTVVDIYGNVLDINRHKITIPELETINTKDAASHGLKRLYSYLRRSVKYHFEINARKDVPDTNLPTKIKNTLYNATEHGRWSVDVDGEGLTKINIPASSETGNIPVLGRYIVSRPETNPAQGQFKDPQKQDVRLLPFGYKTITNGVASFSGPTIVDKEYVPITVDGYVAAGTAHHDIVAIAPSIFKSGELKSPDPINSSASVGPVTTKLYNTILPLQENNYQTNPQANAGGRSLHANFDGSAEVSVGADTADRKSLVIDLAGGIVSHYGRDRNGRSVIHQTDGDVIIQIGGKGITGDKRFTASSDTNDRPGRIEIHLNRPGKESHKIIIDEYGMTIDIQGNIALKSVGDFSISAGGKLLLNGDKIHTYGIAGTTPVDKKGNITPGNTERFISRCGRTID